jgi:hypothetical protein
MRALKASVESLLMAVPAGFNEGEERLKEAVRLLEEDGDCRFKSFQTLLFDLFGGRNIGIHFWRSLVLLQKGFRLWMHWPMLLCLTPSVL